MLGVSTLTIDSAAGTVQLGNGPAVPYPVAGDPDLAGQETSREEVAANDA